MTTKCSQLKLKANDGKYYLTDCLLQDDIILLVEHVPSKKAKKFIEWFTYSEMNVAHPFMEGNGRSTRIWLDLILKKNLRLCVDWSKINKKDYLDAMRESTMDTKRIKFLLKDALTDKINDREVYMKGVDYSYYYEQENEIDGEII